MFIKAMFSITTSLAVALSSSVSVFPVDSSIATTKTNLSNIHASPKLSKATDGYVMVGEDIVATSSQNGIIYLVPYPKTNEQITLTKINEYVDNLKGVSSSVKADVQATLKTTGLQTGVYVIYASNSNGEISSPSLKIYLEDTTPAPSVSKIAYVNQGEVGTNKLRIALTISNKELQGIGGYIPKDFSIEISENGNKFKEYHLDSIDKFSNFSAMGTYGGSGFFPGGLYEVSYMQKVLLPRLNLRI